MLFRLVLAHRVAFAATFASVFLGLAPEVRAQARDPLEVQVIGTLGLGLAHVQDFDAMRASGRMSLRGLGWLSDRFGFGLEVGSFAHGFTVAQSNMACGWAGNPCPDTGQRNGGWVAPLAMLSARIAIVRPYAGVSVGLAWASRNGGVGRSSWMSPAVSLLSGASVDLWRFTIALEGRGDAIDDVIDATADLGLGVNF